MERLRPKLRGQGSHPTSSTPAPHSQGVQLKLPDGTSVAMPQQSMVIGSGAGADLPLSGPAVEAQHARLESKVREDRRCSAAGRQRPARPMHAS